MKVLNNKIAIKRLAESEQPQKTFLNQDADTIKLATVISVGEKVTKSVKEGDVVAIYVNDIFTIPGLDFEMCTDRALLFINEYPDENKVHIKNVRSNNLSLLNTADVIKSSSSDIVDGDVIHFRKGQGLILPDNTEIISESQIYYSESKC